MTLIDVAMVLMVMGLLLTPALATYHDWKIKKERETTQKNQLAINKAMADYYFINGEYPCPADPALGPQNADYGIEDCDATEIAGGTAYIGTVPFTELLLPTDISLDGFSNKFTYAVSGNQVDVDDTGTFNLPAVLEVPEKNCADGSVDTTVDPAHFIVISHGANGIGARTADGVLRQACSAPGSTLEAENCDNDITFVEENCTVSDRQGSADFYDDLTFYSRSPPTRIWAESPEPGGDIMTNVSKVGINNLNPQFNLDVVGNIKTSNTWANEICDLGDPDDPAVPADCFNPSLIGGDEPEMDCGDNTQGATIMTGIGGSQAKCNISHTLPETNCAAIGKYIVAIGANGEILCGS